MMLVALLLLAPLVFAQHNMGQFTGSAPTGPLLTVTTAGWWPPAQYADQAGALLPNPGPSMFGFQFLGEEVGQNFITLPRGLSARLPRTMTIEAWLYLPARDTRSAPDAAVLPIASRFNPRLQSGPANLDSHNDFGFEVDGSDDKLRFWMGGGFEVDYGVDVKSKDALPTDEWVHVAVSVLSAEKGNPYFAMLFVNGAEVGSQNWAARATRVFQANEAIALGFRQRGREMFYMEGVLDDVRFWGTARKAADIAAAHDRVLAGDEDGLVALYKLDDFGDRLVHDAGLYSLHGYTLKPLFTLGDPMTLQRRVLGVQGFPVEIALGAVDLVPTAPDGYEFVLDCLPAHGCVSAADDPKVECATAADLGVKVFEGGVLHYTGDSDYLGADEICYRARRVGENELSLPTTVHINVIEAPDTGCVTTLDACGVCGGDGTSCTTGGCDGKGGQFDACMVCGGDGSTCQCAVYKTFTLSDMDCVLLDAAVNRTMVRIENTVATLAQTLDGLALYDPEDKASSLDLLIQIEHLCNVRTCVDTYNAEAQVFHEYVDEYLRTNTLCEPEAKPELLGYFERRHESNMP